MLKWTDYLVAQEHYKDLLREAEKERRARQALIGRDRRNRLYCRALTWMGCQLVVLGLHLQKRYSATVAPYTAPGGQPQPGQTPTATGQV